MWEVYKEMKPRCKSDPAAKPMSAYQVYLGAKRVHEREGFVMPEGKLVLQAMKALTKRFIKKYGFQALIKHRAEPLTDFMVDKFFSLPEGLQLGTVKVDVKSKGYQGWRCMQSVAARTGVRRQEVSTTNRATGLTKLQYTRDSLVFLVAGKQLTDPTHDELKSMVNGDFVLLKPRPSKADQFGAFWCDKPIYFELDFTAGVNPAKELLRQELMDPVHGADRGRKALFATSSGLPFTKSQVASSFKAMVQHVAPKNKWKHYSFHSYRVYLACALNAVKCPGDKIKRILRWISDEALHTYVRDGPELYVEWLGKLKSGVKIDTVQVSNLPQSVAMLEGVYYDSDTDLDDG